MKKLFPFLFVILLLTFFYCGKGNKSEIKQFYFADYSSVNYNGEWFSCLITNNIYLSKEPSLFLSKIKNNYPTAVQMTVFLKKDSLTVLLLEEYSRDATCFLPENLIGVVALDSLQNPAKFITLYNNGDDFFSVGDTRKFIEIEPDLFFAKHEPTGIPVDEWKEFHRAKKEKIKWAEEFLTTFMQVK